MWIVPARLITPIATIALAAGLILSLQSQHKAEQAREKAQRDHQVYTLGSCERGNLLRTNLNQNADTANTIRDVIHQNVTIAAQTDPSPAARLRWAAQARKLEGVETKHTPLVDCRALVKKGLPQR